MDIQFFGEYDHQLLLWFNGSDSVFIDSLMLTLTSGLTWIPLYVSLVYLVVKNSEKMNQILLVLGCSILCVVLSDGMSDFVVKPLVMRPRPSLDPVFKSCVSIVGKTTGTGYSFFSAHAANTFAIAMFVSLVVKSRMLTVTLVSWSLANCYTRLYLGVHYPSDIVAGLVWGAAVGWVVYYIYIHIYRRISPRITYVSSQYTATGYDHNDMDVVMLVFSMTLLYSVLKSVIICL